MSLVFNFDGHGFEEFSGRIESVSGEIPNWIDKDIENEANTLMLRAGAKLQTMEVHGRKHRGLRASIAAGLRVEDTDGGYKITVSVPDTKDQPLPRLLDVGLVPQGWNHPVFGKKHLVWEVGNVSWFSDTMKDAKSETEQKIVDTLDSASDQIQGR